MPNPFQSPRVVSAPPPEQEGREAPLVAERALAWRRYTFTILILAVPAVANLLLFNYFVAGQLASRELFYRLATLNAIGVALVIYGLLLFGFFLLEFVTRFANRLFGTAKQLDRWYEALYDVLGQAWFLAVPAAALWAFWLWMLYGTDVPYFIYGLPSLFLAHLLAASLYVRLVWRWCRIPRQA